MPSTRWSGSSEIKTDRACGTSKDTYPVTKRHNPEDLNIHRKNREKPKSPKYGCQKRELQENTKFYRIRFELRIAVIINTALWEGGGCVIRGCDTT